MLSALTGSEPLLLSVVFVFGLLVGSFLNVVILRLPARMEHEWRCQCRDLLELEGEPGPAPADLVWGRSRCPSCKQLITAWQNIPLLSYLLLRGRCSHCRTRISARYPLVEALTGLLFAAVAWQFGPGIPLLAGLVFTAWLVALSGIDLDHQLLPDNLTLPLLWLGLLASLFGLFTDPVSGIIGAIAGYLILWTIFHLFKLLTGKEGMGYGDFKLMAALGAWMGWQILPLVILLSSLVGALVGLLMLGLKRHQAGQPIPFGPFIAAAGWIALLFGDRLIEFYLRSSGMLIA
ncbi:MAG: prepilin peptidase [Xanthomonadales bacterium]|nr:prepilin peptidase [Xanthomonadales bacterium]